MDTMKQEWIDFWKKLARMLQNGIPIIATLETVRKEASRKVIAETCQVFIEELNKGKSMAEAMECLPACFPSSTVQMIKSGEVSGQLETAMLNVAAGIEEGSLPAGAAEKVTATVTGGGEDKVAAANNMPIVKLVDLILQEAVRQKASDIHLELRPDGLRLRSRVDGALCELERPHKKLGPAIVDRIRLMANMNLAEKRLPQDGRITMDIDNRTVDFRVSYVPLVQGASLVLRLIVARNPVQNLESLFKPDHLATVRRWLKRSQGLIVVNGPGGSGLTTTIYSLLKSLDSSQGKIMTIEDPVEYCLEGICQQQINPAIGLTFPAVLRANQRQAPNVIMIGEVRDLETVELMCQLALYGHLGLTTLHTKDGVRAAKRLVDIGLEPYLVGNILTGVISQRIFRLICPKCKQELKPAAWMKEYFPKGQPPKLFQGKGCEQCHGTGYRGRGVFHEMFEPNSEWISQLEKNVPDDQLQAAAVKAGLVPLRAEGLAKVAEGVTTLEEILASTADLK